MTPELRYDDLLDCAEAAVGASVSDWSDLNAHDPGVTITELLAWQTAANAYRIDQVPTDRRRAFLRLLDAAPAPPSPAETVVTLSPAGDPGRRIPPGTGLRADGVGFETTRPVSLSAGTVDTVLGVTGADSERPVEALTSDAVTEWGATTDPETASWRPFGNAPTEGDAAVVGFDGDPFEAVPVLSLSVVLADEAWPPVADGESTFVPSVSLVWEWYDGEAWCRLPVVGDDTDALYDSGVLRLGRPEDWAPAAEATAGPGQSTPLYWLRCRIEADGYEIPPRVATLSTNGVEVRQKRSAESVPLERVDPGEQALDGRRYAFPASPVQSATVTVDGEAWTEVPTTDTSDPGDCHYVLDRGAGVVQFGGGFRGVAPPPDATVRARNVVYGGGTDGNVTDADWTFSGTDATVEGNDATGGTDAESVTDAVRHFRRRRSKPARAVTTDDYAALAAETPGVRIARTTAHAYEDAPRVTVTVVPYTPPDCGRPVPSDGLLAAVERHLEDVRLLTDRVTVAPPRYAPLDVTVDARCHRTYREGSDRAVATAVRSYVDPLRGGDGDGWPFGETLSLPTLREHLVELESVAAVEDLSVTAYGPSDRVEEEIRIDDRTLFAVASVETTVTQAGGGERD